MLVSIITVTLNSKTVLNDCLDSVANQSHDNIEHIVIDGGSTDGTLTLLNSKRKNLAILISEPDNGIYDAMNKGIAFARGDIVGILNSDDFYVNDQIISNVNKIFTDDPSLGACYADLVYVDRHKAQKTIRYFKSSKFVKGLFAKGWNPPHPTFFVRRSIYNKFGLFNLNYRLASDIDLMFRFLEIHKIKTKYVPEIWVKMRLGGTTNKSLKNIFKQNQEVLKAFREQGLRINTISFLINKIINRLIQYLKI